MMLTKDIILKKFQKNPEEYWKVGLFEKEGFIRKICPICKKGFWALDSSRKHCPNPVCGETYGFIGNPITKRKWDYTETWKLFENFFKKRGHTSIKRYPTICRWRDDLFFVIASIVDFQRLEKNVTTFEYPANPLIIPQVCLRFKDIENVGKTGAHHTCFIMPGQHAFNPPDEGYWKDECIGLNFDFLTKAMGIPKEELIYVEEVWTMPDFSTFGPYMETFSRGLELANSGFMEFGHGFKKLPMKVIDVGWGLERLVWFSNGTPTGYDIVYEPILRFLRKQTGIKYDVEFFLKYSKLAGFLNLDEVKNIKKMREQIASQLGVSVELLDKKIKPLEAMYTISDHTLGLTFAIADGLLPSNTAGGYNLRVILRRALGFIDDFRWDIDLTDVCELHARHLRLMCPELSEHIDEIQKVLDIEKKRFHETKLRTKRIVEAIAKKGEEINEERLIKLYDSKGITPELVQDYVPDLDIPDDFYVKVTERHMGEKKVPIIEKIDVSGLPPTELLYYEYPKKMEFQAKVIKMINDKWGVLDKTYFYPEGGGQKSDVGFIEDFPVSDVQKVGDVVVHRIIGKLEEGKTVNCRINEYRRNILKKHHTATHIVNVAARQILGNHVWQHSAFKSSEKARLDITHYEPLTDDQLEKIEQKANEIVRKNLPVKIEVLPRSEAEKKYGFRIYQGGVVPEDKLRIISVGNIDHEACGGIHCEKTGEVEFITILKTKRIQDGIDRLEFTVGPVALKYLKKRESLLKETAKLLKIKDEKVPEAVKELFEKWKSKRKELRKLRRKSK